MALFLVIVAGLLLIMGFAGTFVPVLPGAPLAWAGLLAAYFSEHAALPLWLLAVCAAVAVIVSVADGVFPVTMTKKSGGSKAGSWGCAIGLVAGFLIGPAGIVAGPLVGAFAGEMLHDSSDARRALRAALGAFKGFLLGTGLKMLAVAAFVWIYVWSLLAASGGR